MVRKISIFYLLAMGLSFAIAIWTGIQGHSHMNMVLYALLAWPLSALLMLARTKAILIAETERARN